MSPRTDVYTGTLVVCLGWLQEHLPHLGPGLVPHPGSPGDPALSRQPQAPQARLNWLTLGRCIDVLRLLWSGLSFAPRGWREGKQQQQAVGATGGRGRVYLILGVSFDVGATCWALGLAVVGKRKSRLSWLGSLGGCTLLDYLTWAWVHIRFRQAYLGTGSRGLVGLGVMY